MLLRVFSQKHKSRQKPVRLEDRQSRRTVGGGDLGDGDEVSFDDPNNLLLDYIRQVPIGDSRSRNYRRPVMHADEVTEIHIRAALYQIVDLDQRNNLATLSAYFDVWWIDPFLPWNRTDFAGISKTFAPANWVWKPEFVAFHAIQGRTPTTTPRRSSKFARTASSELRHFPFDENNCSFLIGSWSYQSKVVRLLVEDRDVFLGDFYDSQEWLLVCFF
ncbi:Neur-chan-LBD domain-containing protein [Aphelenchoides fujianensis]|nr:Neur-chan-LBD domain-containing protein [Aphelenchoides fujianensis]